MNPEDAARAGIYADGEALLESRVHSGPVAVKLTDEIRAGVVSLPHGWGHARRSWQKVAGAHPGVSANDWTDSTVVESVVGQSVLNGVPVRLRPLATASFDRTEPDPHRGLVCSTGAARSLGLLADTQWCPADLMSATRTFRSG